MNNPSEAPHLLLVPSVGLVAQIAHEWCKATLWSLQSALADLVMVDTRRKHLCHPSFASASGCADWQWDLRLSLSCSHLRGLVPDRSDLNRCEHGSPQDFIVQEHVLGLIVGLLPFVRPLWSAIVS